MPNIFPPNTVLMDNTLFTAATRALQDQQPASNDFDFLALIELTQSFLCYETIVVDATSRQDIKDIESWNTATSPWTKLQEYAVKRIDSNIASSLGDRETQLDSAARTTLLEAARGKFVQSYTDACIEMGVSDLLPNFYFGNDGFDDERFRRAEDFLRSRNLDLTLLDKNQYARPLARYVFRGYYYYQLAISQNVNYCPCALRGKLLKESRLVSEPFGDIAQALSIDQIKLIDLNIEHKVLNLLDFIGIHLSLDINFSPVNTISMPLTFMYVLKVCEEHPTWDFTDAVHSLRIDPSMCKFRDHFGSLLKELRSPQMSSEIRGNLTMKFDELKKIVADFELARGINTAYISLLPFVGTLVSNSKLAQTSFMKSAVDGLSPSHQQIMKVRLPKWLFEQHGLRPHLVLLWKFLEERSILDSARNAFRKFMEKKKRPE